MDKVQTLLDTFKYYCVSWQGNSTNTSYEIQRTNETKTYRQCILQWLVFLDPPSLLTKHLHLSRSNVLVLLVHLRSKESNSVVVWRGMGHNELFCLFTMLYLPSHYINQESYTPRVVSISHFIKSNFQFMYTPGFDYFLLKAIPGVEISIRKVMFLDIPQTPRPHQLLFMTSGFL